MTLIEKKQKDSTLLKVLQEEYQSGKMIKNLQAIREKIGEQQYTKLIKGTLEWSTQFTKQHERQQNDFALISMNQPVDIGMGEKMLATSTTAGHDLTHCKWILFISKNT